MSSQSAARIFVSYSHKDGAEYAANLRRDLEAQDFTLWRDLESLRGGRDWWSQIEEALRSKSVEHFILVVSPAALASSVVRREIRLARQEGCEVSPIKGPGLVNLNELPRWVGQLYDLDLPQHRSKLVQVLTGPSQQRRVPMMAPEPPADFVARPNEFDALKRQLLDASQRRSPMTRISRTRTSMAYFGSSSVSRAAGALSH
jgi:hypothetical protein